jgi:hypothetical protein
MTITSQLTADGPLSSRPSGRQAPAGPLTGGSSTLPATPVLSLDAHAVGDEGHAGAGIRHAVQHHQAVEANAHGAVDTAGGPTGGATSAEAFLGNEHRGHRFAGEGLDRPVVEDDGELAASFETVFRSQWEAASRENLCYFPISLSRPWHWHKPASMLTVTGQP